MDIHANLVYSRTGYDITSATSSWHFSKCEETAENSASYSIGSCVTVAKLSKELAWPSCVRSRVGLEF